MKKIIETGLSSLNLTDKVPENSASQMARYGAMLIEKNAVMNLTAITDPVQVAELHMLDSACLLPLIELENKTLLDVGTGAGFPGLALKILVPSLTVTLLDSLNKRLDWLMEVGETLGLHGMSTLHARAEEQALLPNYRDSFDVVTARAVAQLPFLCELCLPFVAVDGLFVSMKSAGSDEELAAAAGCIARLGGQLEGVAEYTIPGTDVTHRVVMIRKITPTPNGYPRRWSKIKKSPL